MPTMMMALLLPKHLWQCFSPAAILASYMATLPLPPATDSDTPGVQTLQMILRVVLSAAATLVLLLLHFFVSAPPALASLARVWQLVSCSIQFVCTCGLFLLICQRPPSSTNGRGNPNYYYLSLQSLAEHAYTLPLLGLCRVASSQLQFLNTFRHYFDFGLGCVLGPICTVLLLALPSSSHHADLSTPADLSAWEPWLLFVLLAAVQLDAFGTNHHQGGHRTQSMVVIATRGTILCAGIAAFHVRRLSPSSLQQASKTSDFYFFRAFVAQATAGQGHAQYVLQGTLLLWLGLLASRWFEELLRCFFFAKHCLRCEATKTCMQCYSTQAMKEDVDDACASLAVAGIFLSAYAISSRPLPEIAGNNAGQQHSFVMLPALGVLAAVIVGAHVVHAGMRTLLLASQSGHWSGMLMLGSRFAAEKQHRL